MSMLELRRIPKVDGQGTAGGHALAENPGSAEPVSFTVPGRQCGATASSGHLDGTQVTYAPAQVGVRESTCKQRTSALKAVDGSLRGSQ